MICAACMTPAKCGEVGCKVLHPENHPPRAVIDSGLGHALNVADPDEAHANALREIKPADTKPDVWVWVDSHHHARISLLPLSGADRYVPAARLDGLRAELAHLVRLLEPLERSGALNVPGLATLNGARAALDAEPLT